MLDADPYAAVAEAIADGLVPDWDAADLTASARDEREPPVFAAYRDLAIVGRLFATVATLGGQASPPREPLATGDAWGAFRIKAHLGRGSFGDVYRAWDPALDRDVALKLIDSEASSVAGEVVAEGRLMARVRHPNVIAIHGAQRIGEVTGLVMELVEGHTLEQELSQRGRFAADELIDVGIDVCRALAAVHAAGLVHRDVKASNILRERASGRVMLGDFGTGRAVDDEGTYGGGFVGTPVYSAPEVFQRQPATAQSDLYSLGVLLFRLASGEYPFHERSIRSLRDAHASGGRVSLRAQKSALPDALVAVIDRALDREPARRFESAEAMARALESCRSRARSRRTVVWATVSVVMLVALVAAATRFLSRTPAPVGFAERDAVLVTKFENTTGQPDLERPLEYAFELELANSAFVTVASRDRIIETLALMRRPADAVVDQPTAIDIAQRDGHIRVVLAGRLDRIGNAYSMSVRIVNPNDSSVVGSAATTSSTVEGLLQAVGGLARDVRQRLGETLPALSGPTRALPRVQTRSTRALTLYRDAHGDLSRIVEPQIAKRLLGEAITEDPEFTLAYIALAQAMMRTAGASRDPAVPAEVRALLDRAEALVAGSSMLDRYIVGAESHAMRGMLANRPEQRQERRSHNERALDAARLWLQLEPSSERAIDLLLDLHGRLTSPPAASLPLVRRLVELRPNSLGALSRAVGQLSAAAEFTEARGYLARARPLVADPASVFAFDLPRWFFDDAWAQGNIEEARAWVSEMERRHGLPAGNRANDYSDYIYFGYLTLGQLDSAEAAVTRVPNRRGQEIRAGTILLIRGDRERLRSHASQALRGGLHIAPVSIADLALYAGDLAQARRAIALEDPGSVTTKFFLARLAFAEGDTAKAISLVQPIVAKYSGQYADGRWSRPTVFLANALDATGQTTEAIRVLETFGTRRREIQHPGIAGAADWLMARDRLAQLYRATGQPDKAVPIETELRTLLQFADADHPIVRRLATVSR